MLIEFQVENFRSFRERQVFSMVASHFAEHRDSNTFSAAIKGFDPLVRTAVIYGANASGKTNLLLAMNFMKNFVATSAAVTAAYPFSPFKLAKKCAKRPSHFQIAFVQDAMRYEYGFSMGAAHIEKEWLVEYAHVGKRARGRAMFERTWNGAGKKFDWKFSTFLKGQKDVWAKATRPNALFLSTAIQLNGTQLQPVFDWFLKKLVVIVGPITLNESLTLSLLDHPDGREKLLPFLREADLGIADVHIKKEPIPAGGALVLNKAPLLQASPQTNAAHVVTVTMSHIAENNEGIGIDLSEESTGTQLLFKTAGAWLNVLANGEILVLDEIDSNMHPALLKFLIDRFHSAKTNPNNAQLICSTHNTSILQKSMFRRDQIWFVEKGRDGASKVYPLTDFNPRSDESFERAYMRGQYGAQPILPSSVD